MAQDTLLKLREICAARLEFLRSSDRLSSEYEEYQSRFEYELKVIGDFQYQNIFLITRQFIRYARSKGVIVGPGRGSAAGSLICYLCEITTVDPLKFGLYFERFLNPGRVTSPDIDVDFSDREVPIEFLREAYGENRVIQVGTKGLFKIKSALDQFARVFDVPFEEAKRITACYDNDGNVVRFDDAAQYQAKYPLLFETAKFFADSKRYRNPSKHPSAVIVTNKPIGRMIPLQQVTDSKTKQKVFTTEWDGDELDSLGYTKFDILRVSSLKVIADTVSLANRRAPGSLPEPQFIFEHPSLDDRETLELFNRGDLVGIFQLWKPECIQVARGIEFRGFQDVYQLTTVLRPGIDRREWVNKHEGEESVTFICRELEPILRDTFGIILFQEQIMRICSELAGFTLAESDTIRKIIAKTSNIGDTLSLDPYKEKFVTGCVANNILERDALAIWEEILRRQKYGFNKSHAVSYSIVSWVCGYLKAHFPLEFFVASLNDKNESRFIEDAKAHGVRVLPPDVNMSQIEHSIEGDAIRIGLSCIKKVGKTAGKIIKMRPYSSFTEFNAKTKIASDKVESLKSAGAFSSIPRDEFSKIPVRRAGRNHFEIMFKEKGAVGYFVTGTPLDEYGDALLDCETDSNCFDKVIKIGGIVTDLREWEAKTGTMLFLNLQTMGDEFNLIVWPSDYKKCSHLITMNAVIVGTGKKTDRGGYSLHDIKAL